MKSISREEVLRHNQPGDCWIIIKNQVYDITDFLLKHPGGMDVLLSRAGEDATSFFITRHQLTPGVTKMLQRYHIGQLPEHQHIPEHVFQEPFINDLLEAISAAKLFSIDEITKRHFFFLRTFAVSLFFLLSVTALYLSENILLSVALVILQALVGTSLFGLIAHEATHRLYPYQPFLQKTLKLVWPVFWPFISQKPLYYEHNSHHFKIGDPEYDFEVAGFSKLIRYSGKVEHTFWHRWQHRLAVFFYPFYANIITTFGGALTDFWSRHNRKVYWEHGLTLLMSALYFIILPGILTGHWWTAVLLYMVYQCTLYQGIYVGAAINHFTPHCAVAIPEDKKNLYGYYICSNTTNFRTFHPFWFWYTGGFNVQIEHHLVPFVPVENLHKLVPIVQSLCQKHGYPYKEYSTFRKMWKEHYEYLSLLSKEGLSNIIQNETRNKAGYQPR